MPLNSEDGGKEKEREPTIEEQSLDRISLSSSPTAPATPVASKKQSEIIQPKPRALPRAFTAAEPMVNLDVNDDFKHSNMSPISLKNEKQEKTEKADNIFSKKWNKFRKELTPAKQDEQIRNQYNKTAGNGGERIIIGGENMFSNQKFTERKVEVPKEILAKYDGKSKEVSFTAPAGDDAMLTKIFLFPGNHEDCS